MKDIAATSLSLLMAAVAGNAMAQDVTIPGHEVARGHKTYMLLDPVKAELTLVENGKILGAYPALVGAAKNSNISVEASTPAGSWPTTYLKGAAGPQDDIIIFACRNTEVCLVIHNVIPTKQRLDALKTPTPSDNNLTNGCINVSMKVLSAAGSFMERAANPVTKETPRLFILPYKNADIPKYFPNYRP